MARGGSERAVKSLERLIHDMAEKKGIDPHKAVHIFRLIVSPTNSRGLSDEDLEPLTGYKQGEIRKILRLLYDLRLATYRRGRHPKTGSTRYYWVVDREALNTSIVRRKKAVLEKLKTRLEHERSNTFYVCPQDGSRYTFDEAFDYEFVCPRCGFMLEEDKSSAYYVRALEREIARLEEEIKRDERDIFGS